MKKMFYAILMGLFLLNPVVNASEGNDEFKGSWEYEDMYDFPYGYQSGKITFFTAKDVMKAKVELEYASMDVEKITVKEGKLTFDLYVDGSPVYVELQRTGIKLEGYVTVDGSKIPIELSKSDK